MLTTAKSLTEDLVTPYDPRTREDELHYFADGTSVVMRWKGGEKVGIAVGMALGGIHAWQVVEWPDGTRDNVAPHVLHRSSVQ